MSKEKSSELSFPDYIEYFTQLLNREIKNLKEIKSREPEYRHEIEDFIFELEELKEALKTLKESILEGF